MTIVKVLMALGVVAFVGYPLLRETMGLSESDIPEEVEDLHRLKEATYSALKELEFDYRTGKLSEADYQELEAKYKGEAVEVLEAIERAETGAPENEESRPGAVAAATEAVQPGDCVACGRQNPPDARFCASCGEPLAEALLGKEPDELGTEDEGCPDCGQEMRPGAKFCADCGAELAG